MDDIGMSPDYRSGVSETVECEICGRHRGCEMYECTLCGKEVCYYCSDRTEYTTTCSECYPTDDGGDVLPIE